MKHLGTAIAFVLAIVSLTKGQVGTCPNIEGGSANCFFDGVATLLPTGSNSNRFFVIGGLFDVHAKGSDAYACETEISDKAILNVLAFFWAVDRYDKAIVTGSNNAVSIGAFAFDNCFRPEQTIENLLGFSQCKLFLRGIRENVVAYVGPYRNEDALRTGMVASDLSLTLVSPDANSYEFDDVAHKSLLRMRPNFDYDIMAILKFLDYTRSRHIVVVHSDEQFYMDAYNSFMKMLEDSSSDLCVNRDLMMPSSFTENDVAELVKNELEDQGLLRYIVPFMSGASVNMLMKAVHDNEFTNDKPFAFLLNSNIGSNSDITSEGVVVVEPRIVNADLTQFNNDLQRIRNNEITGNFGLSSLTNPWLNEYLAQAGKTEVPLVLDANHPSEVVQSVSRTILAVRQIAEGMNIAIEAMCGESSGSNYQVCDNLRNPTTARDAIFRAVSEAYNLLSDSEPAAANVEYSYYVYRVSDSTFHNVGTYEADTDKAEFSIPTGLVAWFDRQYRNSSCPDREGCCVMPTNPPMSTAATGPMMSTTPAPTEAPSDDVLVRYPRGQEITGAYADHSSGREYDIRFEDGVGQNWVIALGVLAGLGILCVLVFEVYIMYKMIGNQMSNKWRTMWLGQLLLFGIFAGYLTLIAYIFVPTDATCGITRFGVGVSYAICFAVLLVKLMVILTSKSSDVLLPGDGDSPNYLKGVYQFLMFIFAVGVQVVISVQWLITVPPESIRVISRSGSMVWVCNHYTWEAGKNMLDMEDFVRTNFENHLLSLVYIMVLILITTILSLKAHGIITNHRESVFIGIASGFSIPIWLAWGLVGGLNKDHDYAHEFGDACIAFGLLITLTLILFAMFLPKVRQLVNMGVEGIYLEDDRDTYYGGSVIMAPPSYKSKGPSSVIYVNNQGIYSEPVIIGNGDPTATHLKHPGSTYSAPPGYLKKSESTYGGSRVLRVTDDLKGRHPQKKAQSEVNYGASTRSRSYKGGTLPRSRSQSDLGAL